MIEVWEADGVSELSDEIRSAMEYQRNSEEEAAMTISATCTSVLSILCC